MGTRKSVMLNRPEAAIPSQVQSSPVARNEVATHDDSQLEREATRCSLQVPVELQLGDYTILAQIRNVSRFGAFVHCRFAFRAGESVRIAFVGPGNIRATTRCTVVYQINEADAARLDTVIGIGVRFRDPCDAGDAAFARSVEALLAAQLEARSPTDRVATGKPTRKMIGPIAASLATACRGACLDGGTVVFAGSLEEVGLKQILCMLGVPGKSRRIVLTRNHETITIEMVSGRVAEATCVGRDLPRKEIVMMALDWEDGTFEVRTSASYGHGAQLDTVMQLLIEHARTSDRPTGAGSECRH